MGEQIGDSGVLIEACLGLDSNERCISLLDVGYRGVCDVAAERRVRRTRSRTLCVWGSGLGPKWDSFGGPRAGSEKRDLLEIFCLKEREKVEALRAIVARLISMS